MRCEWSLYQMVPITMYEALWFNYALYVCLFHAVNGKALEQDIGTLTIFYCM